MAEQPNTNSVAFVIGGNSGDRHALLHQAVQLIGSRIGTVQSISHVYETEPWGDFGSEAQVQNFLNQALLVSTPLDATQVLRRAQAIEATLGRQRKAQPTGKRIYASRTMDIDIIFFNSDIIDTPQLQVPHPRMHLRRFVLEPLADVMPQYKHPRTGKTVAQMLAEVDTL